MRHTIKGHWHRNRAVWAAAIFATVILEGVQPAILAKADDIVVQGETEENEMITEYSLIVAAVGEVDAKEAPDENAAVVVSYHDGDNIYVTGETANGWYRVQYQALTGYVRMEQTKEIAFDVEALNEEFAVEEEEGKLVVEEVERQRAEVRRSKIWGAVIILLVLGVFAMGIVTTVKSGREGDSQE